MPLAMPRWVRLTCVHIHPLCRNDPELWVGAASIMGNSVRQWKASYAPTLRMRQAQLAMDTFLTPRHVGGQADVALLHQE